MRDQFSIQIVHAREHEPDHYRVYLEGQRACQLVDHQDRVCGECVWRVATGHTVEITEMGIYDARERRQGWGSTLLQAALEDMHAYLQEVGDRLRCVYLFCEAQNHGARAFYEARGFRHEAVLPAFYRDGDAMLYVLHISGDNTPCREAISSNRGAT